MASTFGVADELNTDEEQPSHEGHEHSKHALTTSRVDEQDGDSFTHPWAREMYRQGLSFNGDERSKLFWGRGDGRFIDISDLSGADSPLDGRALLTTDFDDDGDLDLFVHNLQRDRHELFRNELDPAPGGAGFVKVRLFATTGQYEAIGASVVLRGARGATAQIHGRGAGFLSCQAPELVFGLGRGDKGELEVSWPGGVTESFGAVEAGSRVLLVEGQGKAKVFSGKPSRLLDPLPQGVKLLPGETLPKLLVLDRSGKRVELDPKELAGDGRLYLNFWASYCGPCVREIPALSELDDQAGARVVAISVDAEQDRERAQRVLDGRGAAYHSAYLSMDDDDNAGGLDRVVDLMRLSIPTTLVIDGEGRLVEVIQGTLEPE